MDLKIIDIGWAEFENMAISLASQVVDSNWKPDYVVGIVRGGVVPATVISHQLAVPMWALRVSLRDGGVDTCETNCWMPDDVVAGKNILIVDDINDSGNTLAWIRNDWQSSMDNDERDDWWHDRVRVAVLVDNLGSDENVDYVATVIDKRAEPSWVSFPWERQLTA